MDSSRLPTDAAPSPRPAPWSVSDPARVTIPIIEQVEKRLADRQYARAVLDAYHRVVLDLQKAYGLTLPAQWTHREFLSEFLRDDMGVLTRKVEALYRLYEPVRYGTEADWTIGDPIDLLKQIYLEPPMRDLYLRSANASGRDSNRTSGVGPEHRAGFPPTSG
jgi:hypothetical protein